MTGLAVFQPVQHLAQDAEAGRHQAAGIPRVNALGQDLHFQHPAGHAAQAVGQPELVVIAGTGVQADHQPDLAQPGLERIHIVQQVVRTAFFAGLNQTHDARVAQFLGLECLQGCNGGIRGIAIVRATTAIELAVLIFGSPRSEVVAPTGELGLLVQMAIHQHRLAGGRLFAGFATTGLDFEKQDRRAALEADDFQRQAGYFLGFDPLGGVAHHGIEQARRSPVGVKHRRLGRDADVIGQAVDDVLIPSCADVVKGLGGIENGRGNAGVHGAPAAN